MNSSYCAFFDFRDALSGLACLSDSQQVHALKYRLYLALERAGEAQLRARTLQQQLELLKTERTRDNSQQHSVAAQAARELAETRRLYDDRLAAMKDNLDAAHMQCAELERLCQSLVATIERSANSSTSDCVSAASNAC